MAVKKVVIKKERKQRISQSDMPARSLSDAIRVSDAIIENYAGDPSLPLDVAQALGMTPTSSHFKMLTGAAIAYGLTDGGYGAPQISVTALGQRIGAPLEEGDDLVAKREALIKPRVIGEFLTKYNTKQIPKSDIAANVLHTMGCPKDRAAEIFEIIVTEAEILGLISDIKGKKFVNLGANKVPNEMDVQASATTINFDEVIEENSNANSKSNDTVAETSSLPAISSQNATSRPVRKVFITHGKDKAFIEPIKKLLAFGELEPVVSVEKQSVSQPVPDKVMNDMRGCEAAIIHIDNELTLMSSDAQEHIVLNPNVLIEIGASMALYGKRFIFLVKEGVTLPSNLQGLFEVRYSGDELNGEATIRLMEAINELKTTPSENSA